MNNRTSIFIFQRLRPCVAWKCVFSTVLYAYDGPSISENVRIQINSIQQGYSMETNECEYVCDVYGMILLTWSWAEYSMEI
jgi:hypothetical protein